MSHTVYISAIIHAPLEQVWPMFRDFNGLAGWHPGVAVSRLEDGGRADALGSVRHLTLQPSGFVREQLLMLDDPGTALRYSIIETDLPMRDYVAGVQLRRVTEGGLTLVEWWADFRVEAGADLAAVAGAVGQGVFAAGLKALDESCAARSLGLPARLRAARAAGRQLGRFQIIADRADQRIGRRTQGIVQVADQADRAHHGGPGQQRVGQSRLAHALGGQRRQQRHAQSCLDQRRLRGGAGRLMEGRGGLDRQVGAGAQQRDDAGLVHHAHQLAAGQSAQRTVPSRPGRSPASSSRYSTPKRSSSSGSKSSPGASAQRLVRPKSTSRAATLRWMRPGCRRSGTSARRDGARRRRRPPAR